jgi:hypothetical protein
MNVAVVDFHRKKLVKIVKNKKELVSHKKTHKKSIIQFINDAKEGLTSKQYLAVLEAIVSLRQKEPKNQQLCAIIDEYYRLI